MMKRLVSIFVLAAALFTQVSFAGLVGHWTLEDGSGLTAVSAVNSPTDDGTLAGGASFVPGALELDGADGWIDTSVIGVAGAGARTVTAWIKVGTDGFGGAIVSWGDSWTEGYKGGRFTFNINSESGELRAEIGGSYVNGTTIVTDNQWHHVAVTTAAGDGDTANVKFYIDGQLDAVSTFANDKSINSQAAEITLGGVIVPSYPTGNTKFFYEGLLADVRVYDEELDQEAIAALVPEPMSMLLMGIGSVGLISRKRKP